MVDRCGECGGRESRFDGINLFVEYAGARLEVANLSGWRCDACGDVRFDPESATRYADAEDRLVLEEDQLQRSEVPREAGLTQTALDAADTLGAVGAGGLRPCWICGDPADSDEHRRKRSDLVSRYGRSWKPEQQPFVIRGDGRSFWTRLQGPDDRKNLYRKMLCCACNNARTRPFDKAYQAFSNWVLAMGATLHEKEEINFVEIFGMAWEARTLDLLRYFTKCLGCQIVHAGVDVPEELRQIIYDTSRSDIHPLALTFGINEFWYRLDPKGRILGDDCFHSWPKITERQCFSWLMTLGYLDIFYWYDLEWKTDIRMVVHRCLVHVGVSRSGVMIRYRVSRRHVWQPVQQQASRNSELDPDRPQPAAGSYVHWAIKAIFTNYWG